MAGGADTRKPRSGCRARTQNGVKLHVHLGCFLSARIETPLLESLLLEPPVHQTLPGEALPPDVIAGLSHLVLISHDDREVITRCGAFTRRDQQIVSVIEKQLDR